MSYNFHELDPKGDVVLIVQDSNAAFAFWDETQNPPLPVNFEIEFQLEHEEEPCVSEPEDEIKSESPCDPQVFEEPGPWQETPPRSVSSLVLDKIDIPFAEIESAKVHMRVSSRHLTLASPYFTQLLKESSKEGKSLYSDGSLIINLVDCHSGALLILMNVIHGRTQNIPRSISLETLAKFAVLVDCYACAEVVGLVSEMWIYQLKDSIPKILSRDLILWIYISYIFRDAKIFKAVTGTALKQSRRRIKILDLPIPERIVGRLLEILYVIVQNANSVDMIDQQRQEFIKRIFTALKNLIDDLRDCEGPCSFECSSILLGALTKEMHKRKLFSPLPELHLLGFSCVETAESIRNIRSPKWCSEGGRHWSYHGCSLESYIEPIVKSSENCIIGLSLMI